MIVELTVLVAIVAAMGAAVVKIYEWRQDVLFGPYLARGCVEPKRRR
jgi:prepilin signal peptidase PulO-like enzyme (type II secretory pathway)